MFAKILILAFKIAKTIKVSSCLSTTIRFEIISLLWTKTINSRKWRFNNKYLLRMILSCELNLKNNFFKSIYISEWILNKPKFIYLMSFYNNTCPFIMICGSNKISKFEWFYSKFKIWNMHLFKFYTHLYNLILGNDFWTCKNKNNTH